MAGVNLRFEVSIKWTLNSFLLQVLRSSAVESTSRLGKYPTTTHLDFKG